MSAAYDPERLLQALPFRPVTPGTGLLEGYQPPTWRGPLLKPYNGFSGLQRVRTWELGSWLRRRKKLFLGNACDLCGHDRRLGGHSENYADVERALTLCSGCHLTIHLRFKQPVRWRKALDRLSTVPDWATALPSEPFDLAGWLALRGWPTDPLKRLVAGQVEPPRVQAPAYVNQPASS